MSQFDGVEVLLVEDSEHDAEMTIRALKQFNLNNKLYWVRDGVEALEFLRCSGPFMAREPSERPRLILLDLHMPRLDGLELLRTLKADQQTHAIPVVVMTVSTEETDLTESLRLGVNAYVRKPVDHTEFADVIGRIGMYWLLVNRAP
jgi:two-component system response regulator